MKSAATGEPFAWERARALGGARDDDGWSTNTAVGTPLGSSISSGDSICYEDGTWSFSSGTSPEEAMGSTVTSTTGERGNSSNCNFCNFKFDFWQKRSAKKATPPVLPVLGAKLVHL
mmetsp:Transcript_125059/g.353971  ORF Transcript_125059/g.353971 Transcript_125059/m.353971 type:complete len:117 (+) Transcript_125059:95-445(+)